MKTKLFIALLFLLCGFVAYANNSLERKVEASREYQSDLAKANDKLRAEKLEIEKKIKPLKERLDKVEWRIGDNKKLWEIERTKQDVLLGLIKER